MFLSPIGLIKTAPIFTNLFTFRVNFMRNQFFSFLLLISFASGISAQKTQTPKPDLTEQNLRKHVAYLAGDKLEGRRTGEQGATFAAGYVANMFAQYKLKAGSPAANGKTNFLQPFPYVSALALGEANSLEFKQKENGGKIALKLKDEWTPLGFSASETLENLPLVDVGYGISAKNLNYDDYRGIDVKNSVVIAIDGTPDRKLEQYADPRRKARAAREAGAKALILITDIKQEKFAKLRYDNLGDAGLPVIAVSGEGLTKTDELRLPKTGVGSRAPDGTEHTTMGSTDITTKPDGTTIVKKSNGTTFTYKTKTEGAEGYRRKADGKTLVTNPDRTTVELENDFLSHEFDGGKEEDFTVSIAVDLSRKNADAYNVVGVLEGTDANLKNEAIVIGAHYDHLGKGGAGSLAVNSTAIHHGADDNASGVAAMLEMARRFAAEKKNKRTIVFVAFGGEEEGLLGSNFYVGNPAFALEKTAAMINLDMVGRLNENKLNVSGIGTASEWKSLVENTNVNNSVAVFPESLGLENRKIKTEIDRALREKGHRGVITEVKDDEITLRGVIAKGKIDEALNTAMVIGKRKTINYLIEDASKIAEYAKLSATVPFSLQLSEDGFGPSDHSSFYAKQIPVLFFFTGTHADYHKPTDTAEKINYAGLLKVTDYVSEIVSAIDQNPKRPTYAVAKSSNTGGRASFNVTIGVVPSYAESSDGLLLDGVRDASPAALAGIKAGDKIVRFAGKEIRNISDYTFILGELKADTEYEIEVLRGKERLILKVKPAARK
jgi:hypothetical protein